MVNTMELLVAFEAEDLNPLFKALWVWTTSLNCYVLEWGTVVRVVNEL
jgi:hypothetical protein